MPDYRLALLERDRTVVESDVLGRVGIPAGEADLTHTRVLNTPPTVEFTIPADDPFVTEANFEGLFHEIELYRTPEDGPETLVAAGPIVMGEYTSKVAVRFTAKGHAWILGRREVDDDLVYNSEDELDIAWGLIAFTQAKTDGNIGITRSSATPAGTNRSITYCADARPVILDEIASLGATIDGFDWEVGPDRVFRTWSPQRGTETDIVLDAATNVVGLEGFARDWSAISNEVTGVKGGGNCETPVFETTLDASSRARYGLYQSNVAESKVSASHLLAIAEDALRIATGPRIQPVVVLDSSIADLVDMPDLSEYNLGDEVTYNASLGWASAGDLFRIVGITALAKFNGRERISLTLDSVLLP